MGARCRAAIGVLVASALLATAGCGDRSGEAGSSLVEPDKATLINSLEIDPSGDALLLTTNRGFYRVEDGEATRVTSEVSTPDGRSPVGRFLAVTRAGDGETLIGSGHPDEKKRLAPFLGLIRSDDGGATWSEVSRYGFADLHVLRPLDARTLYAYDAVLPALLTSDDGGKTFKERSAPPDVVVDFVVDPDDPSHLLASTKDQMYRSTDAGSGWSAVARAESARLEWAEAGSLYRADSDGLVYSSDDGGDGWDLVGRIDGEPWKLRAGESGELYAALADGSILVSGDGGESWEGHFTP